MIKFDQRNKILTEQIHRAGYKSVKDAQNTTLSKKKKRAEARLNFSEKKLRVKMIHSSDGTTFAKKVGEDDAIHNAHRELTA